MPKILCAQAVPKPAPIYPKTLPSNSTQLPLKGLTMLGLFGVYWSRCLQGFDF